MSDPVLHIKDAYYFELPKFLWPSHRKEIKDFPEVWVKNDEDFQVWEARRLWDRLEKSADVKVELPELGHVADAHGHGVGLLGAWEHWQHEGAKHENFGKPLDLYLESLRDSLVAEFQKEHPKVEKGQWDAEWSKFLTAEEAAHTEGVWFAKLFPPADKTLLSGFSTPGKDTSEGKWIAIKKEAGDYKAVHEFQAKPPAEWSEQKLAAYNDHLSGKILIPQPFGELRNMYEAEPGHFTITKFMVIELFVGLVMFTLFTWVAGRMKSGLAPKGRLWNFFEVFLVFIRDQIARPAIGGGHHEEAHAAEGHVDEHGMAPVHGTGGELPGIPTEIPDGHGHHDEVKHGHAHDHHDHHGNDADRYVPLLWTIFFFVLGCNLFGLVPWFGSPTGAWGMTLAMAVVTLFAVWIGGTMKFGFLGFFKNQIPSMDLPFVLALFLKPMIFGIEMMGLIIKHFVLSVRLLANMVAGHLVILGLMGLAFGAEAALTFNSPDVPGWLWWPVAAVTVLSATLFNILELFVAFLQAYVFTFLSALFIGASVHKH